jgi:DNA-binding XRE family transcriptional regulator
MTIPEYLKKHKLSQGQFARKIGVYRQSVSQWLDKRNYPNRKTAQKIERLTDAEVTIQDIYG